LASRVSFPGLPEPHAWRAAEVCNELDAGFFEYGANEIEVEIDRPSLAGFKSHDARFGRANIGCKVGLRPIKHLASSYDLSWRDRHFAALRSLTPGGPSPFSAMNSTPGRFERFANETEVERSRP
jgi:hypothetical protein